MRLEIDEIKEGSLEEFIERHDLRLVLTELKNGRSDDPCRWEARIDGLWWWHFGRNHFEPAHDTGHSKQRALFELCEAMRGAWLTFSPLDTRGFWARLLERPPAGNVLRNLRLCPRTDYDTPCSSNPSTTSSPPPSSPCTKAPRRAASKRSAPSTAK